MANPNACAMPITAQLRTVDNDRHDPRILCGRKQHRHATGGVYRRDTRLHNRGTVVEVFGYIVFKTTTGASSGEWILRTLREPIIMPIDKALPIVVSNDR